MQLDLVISRLGAQGDGIAEVDGASIFVPFTLPGERVTVEVDGDRGHMVALHQPSPERQTPLCRHFGICGGCALQHMAGGSYRAWKRQRVVEALAMEHIDTEILDTVTTSIATRRRATVAAIKTGGTLALGFRRASSHDIVDLEECPVLAPRLAAVLPGLREFLTRLLPAGESRVQMTAADNGLDLQIEGASKLTLKSAHGAMAEALGILRVTAGKTLVYSIGQPQVSLSDVLVDVPPGAFLQASTEAENVMTALAVEAVGKARKIADLFCGLGTFSFVLARKANVTAVEYDRALLAALETAGRRAHGIKPLKILPRDLMREPLSPNELNAFDAVLFDPPRAGALAQAKALARSRVAKVVAVSCNPNTFARDARTLIDGGYALQRVVPVDQFVFSAHVELVAVFARR
jgi:23S rRNA (uracil1939-C5)-methyltransferase